MAVVRRALEAFPGGDFDAALETVSPKIVSVRNPPLPDQQISYGPDGVQQMWADWTTDFDRFEMWVGEVADVRGRVILEARQPGTGRSSGVEVEGRFWFLFTVDDGTISSMDAFASREEAMEAAQRD